MTDVANTKKSAGKPAKTNGKTPHVKADAAVAKVTLPKPVGRVATIPPPKKTHDRHLFGTDGIRGMANEPPMTPELALALGKAVAYVAGRNKAHIPRILIGKDTRLSGYMIEQAIAAGICSMGARVILCGPLPTPRGGTAHREHACGRRHRHQREPQSVSGQRHQDSSARTASSWPTRSRPRSSA